jgi:CYTH domain-containing protein
VASSTSTTAAAGRSALVNVVGMRTDTIPFHDGAMGTEIERKFRVDQVPDIGTAQGDRLRQGYVALDGTAEVRIRIAEGGATLTVKSGSGLARTEVEIAVDEDQAGALWSLSEGRRVEKTRYRLPLDGGLVAEVDRYEGALAGLCTVEVEFPSEDAARSFAPPAWFGEELTGHRGWSNAELAVQGRPD